MPEAETDRAMAKRLGRPALIIALVVLALAVVNVGSFMILANPGLALMGYIAVGLAFVGGTILVLIGFAVNVSQCRSAWRAHVLALAILSGVFCFCFFTGSVLDLLRIRTNIVLAFTGGQGELQSWAIDLLEQFSDNPEYDSDTRGIPKQYWSRQVRWLRPGRITIQSTFRNGQKWVFLGYPIPHEGMGIMVGPPGAVPPDEPNWDWHWHQFGDGMYYWTT